MFLHPFGWTISLSRKTLWIRFGGNEAGGWIVRTPLSRPLFSERYGYWGHRRFMGFRLGRLDPCPDTGDT